MAPRQPCQHGRAKFHSVQRLGHLPPAELWHCPDCKSTFVNRARRREAVSAA